MTFLFLDRVAGFVGPADALVAAARARLFREPVRHEGLRRLPRDEVRAHVLAAVARAANERLRGPLEEAVTAHAIEAGATHEMLTGEPEGSDGYRDAVVAAFAGNDVGIDMAAFALGEAQPAAVADQVLRDPRPEVAAELARRLGVADADVETLVDDILAPAAPAEWSLEALATLVVRCGRAAHADEIARSLLSDNAELRLTGFELLCHENAGLEEWLDERAMFATPETDESDVAEVLRLVSEKGGGSHPRQHVDSAADKAAAGAEPERPAPAAQSDEWLIQKLTGDAAVKAHTEAIKHIYGGEPLERSKPETGIPATEQKQEVARPVAAEPSDLTRAVAGALKALFELTKESDTNVARTLGVDKAVVAQSRKGITPWTPTPTQLGALAALVGRYNDGLAAAAGALGALPAQLYGEE